MKLYTCKEEDNIRFCGICQSSSIVLRSQYS